MAIRPTAIRPRGSSEAVAKLKPDDVREFYHQYYKLGSAIIAVAGDVNADEIKAALEKEITGLKGNVAPQPAPATQAVAPGIHTQLIDRNVAQANLYMGSNGIARSNPDYYKLQVMNYILGGGGFASRLMKVVRSKNGLAYGISSGFDAGKFAGSFAVDTQTKNTSTNDALQLIVEQLRDMQEHPVSDAELASAKKYLIGSFPLKLDRQSEIVGFMLETEIYGLGLDYAERYPKMIGAVTKDDVQRVAQKVPAPRRAHPGCGGQSEVKQINIANPKRVAEAGRERARIQARARPVRPAAQLAPGG